MKCRPSSSFLLILIISTFLSIATKKTSSQTTLDIGDAAPKLQFKHWIKGQPARKYDKGIVYVLEYWATWCKPCIAVMPHLSELAGKYKGKVIFIGMDVFEIKRTTKEQVKSFVDSLGSRMDYAVAMQDSAMARSWFDASGEEGIPKTFVIDQQGKVAWMGHPNHIDSVLESIVSGHWNLAEARAVRREMRNLKAMDLEVIYQVIDYVADLEKPGQIDKPDSTLIILNEIVSKQPNLKYAPVVAFHTFATLLKRDQQKAYEYGKQVLLATTYQEPACYAIIDPVKIYSERLNLSKEIYQLGAEAYRVRITQFRYPELVDMAKIYDRMAYFHWRGGDQEKALRSQEQAIDHLKNRKDFADTKLADYESRLKLYQKQANEK